MLPFSTSQRAVWLASQNTVPRAIMESPSTLGYRVSQTPSFSYTIGNYGYTNSGLGSGFTLIQGGQSAGNIYVGDISTETGANNIRSVMSVTFRNEWASGLAPGVGNYIMSFIQQANFNQTGKSGFWSLNSFSQFRDDLFALTGRQETDYGIYRAAETLTGDYEDYNNRWLTFISAEAETSSVYTDWNPIAVDTGATTFARTCVYDTETQELLQTLDIAFLPNQPFIEYLDYESLGNIPAYRNSADSMDIGMSVADQYSQQPVKFYNAWMSFGNMWDPKNPPDTSIFTTRPSETIGNTQAWFNVQMTEWSQNAGNTYVFIHDAGDSRYSQANNIVLASYVANSTVANASVSTTIPKDRNI